MLKRFVSVVTALSLTISMSLLAGCTTKNGNSASGKNSKYSKFLTVDVFDSYANFQGIQSGWFAKIVKKKFNMELNIIKGTSSIFQTRSAAGNVGDIILTTAQGGRLQDLVTSGLILDLTKYMSNEKNLNNYKDAMSYTSKSLVKESGMWCVPSEVSKRKATTPMSAIDPNCAAYLRWDLYKQIGYPEIGTLEDLLPVLQKMQAICPQSDSGKKTYAFSLFKDWDGDVMGNAGALFTMYGYGEIGFVLEKADDSGSPIDILASNSPYLRALRFLNKANRMGLIDPESTTQNYDTLGSKYKDGQVLYSIFPFIGATAYNTSKHTSEGKGFMPVEIKDQKIRHWGCYSKGNTEIVAMVGSKTEDPQRMVDFIDWLYSPEGISDATCGPEGVIWEMKNGKPTLTELGKKCYLSGDGTMPAEYGGGSWKDGSLQLSYKIVSAGEVNPNTGFTYDPVYWDSYTALTTNDVIKDWQKKMNAKNPVDFLEKHNELLTSPGCSFSPSADSTNISTLRSQCRSAVVEYSWKAVFSNSEAQCEQYISKMISTVKGLGYSDIVAADMKSTMEQKAARAKVSK